MYTNANSTCHKGRYRSLVQLLSIPLSVFWPANLGCRLLYLLSHVTFNESSGSVVLLCRTLLRAIFFSTTISSQDSIKYLEDLDAERFCIFITHSDHPAPGWSSHTEKIDMFRKFISVPRNIKDFVNFLLSTLFICFQNRCY